MKEMNDKMKIIGTKNNKMKNMRGLRTKANSKREGSMKSGLPDHSGRSVNRLTSAEFVPVGVRRLVTVDFGRQVLSGGQVFVAEQRVPVAGAAPTPVRLVHLTATEVILNALNTNIPMTRYHRDKTPCKPPQSAR